MDQVLSSKETYELRMKEMKAVSRGRDLDASYEVMKRFVRDGNYKITLNNNAQIACEAYSIKSFPSFSNDVGSCYGRRRTRAASPQPITRSA
jgi:hypothetical protein